MSSALLDFQLDLLARAFLGAFEVQMFKEVSHSRVFVCFGTAACLDYDSNGGGETVRCELFSEDRESGVEFRLEVWACLRELLGHLAVLQVIGGQQTLVIRVAHGLIEADEI